eukprot:PITA_27444
MTSTSYFKSDDKLHDKSTYHAWKMSLDLTLEEQDVMDYVQGKTLEPPSNAPVAAKTKYKKGEVKAKKIIRDSIHKNLVAYISDLNTSKEIYDNLVGMFKSSNANQNLFLKNKLKNIKKGKGEDVQSYFMRITEIKNDLLSIGEAIVDMELTLIALGGLPPEWYVFNTTILNNDRIPGFEELLTRCSEEETRLMELEMPLNRNNPTRFSAHAKRKKNACSKKQSRGRPGFKKGKKGRFFVCNKFGHYARVQRSSFKSDREGYKFGNYPWRQRYLSMKEVGNVTLQLNEGNTIHLQGVLYVPDLKKNLVSILTMEDKRFKVVFIDGKVAVWKINFKEAFTLGFRVDNLYQVGGSPLGATSCDTSLQSELWHWRFAHLHYKALPDAMKMVTGMPEFKIEHEGVCQGCVEGKHTRGPFPSCDSKTTNILQLVHSDLSGMLLVTSLGGYLYCVVFVDDFSRKSWIYFLKKKDEIFSWFCAFKALVENKTWKKIKILRTDNGTEYESNEFNDYCREAGIKREASTAYTPEKNGVVERKYHSIIETTRAVLHDQGLPNFLWGDAVNTAVYVQNRCPHQALDSKTRCLSF